nr:hypothetical protein [Tanacetum cinerariifolium]
MRLVTHDLEECDLRYETVDCKIVVKEIEDGILEEMEVSHFGKEFRWRFEQDIGGEIKDDKEKKLVMVNEEECIS